MGEQRLTVFQLAHLVIMTGEPETIAGDGFPYSFIRPESSDVMAMVPDDLATFSYWTNASLFPP